MLVFAYYRLHIDLIVLVLVEERVCQEDKNGKGDG